MFLTFYFLTTLYSTIHPVMFVCFALVGFAWAAINVNSLRMVLEVCRGSGALRRRVLCHDVLRAPRRFQS